MKRWRGTGIKVDTTRSMRANLVLEKKEWVLRTNVLPSRQTRLEFHRRFFLFHLLLPRMTMTLCEIADLCSEHLRILLVVLYQRASSSFLHGDHEHIHSAPCTLSLSLSHSSTLRLCASVRVYFERNANQGRKVTNKHKRYILSIGRLEKRTLEYSEPVGTGSAPACSHKEEQLESKRQTPPH